ncbi:MAG: aspartate aminotransferase family protein [Bryobacteraceae bacterium]
MMRTYPNSQAIFTRNRKFIPGGVVSVNRAAKPEIAFSKALGQYLWDADGNRYLDYHAAFAAHFLGHNDPHVNGAVEHAMRDHASLFGAGTTDLEGRLAELMCAHVPAIESVQFFNSGSEATAQAIRLARAATGRDHVIVMQGGYNGWHNDVACNVMTPLKDLGPRVSPGEYRYVPLSAGIPAEHQALVHPVNYNDLESVSWVCERRQVAALITEPVLQNIGVVKPRAGYLEGLRKLADRFGFVLIFDEVKTGFRHAIGGYSSLCGVTPDLSTYGKAMANGYPMSAVGGKRELMDYFVHPDAHKRVLMAGTYNAHPVPTAASIACIERLTAGNGDLYRRVEQLGAELEKGLKGVVAKLGLEAQISRQGSAFAVYFMDHEPVDWHDLAAHHDFALDERLRQELIAEGIFVFPLATKQCSLSCAHTADDVEQTVSAFARSMERAAAAAASV